MLNEQIIRIRESEEKADEIQKKARSKAKQLLQDARSESAKIIEDAENKAKEIYDGMMSEGQQEADRQYDMFLKKTDEDCRLLIGKAKENEFRAVELITERIVICSVDS